jgi:hypothetical protein
MPALPAVACPRCRQKAEYQSTVEMVEPPIGKIDIGHCAACSCLFEQVRETGTGYDSTSWPPVCRTCRQPVAFAALADASGDIVRFECREPRHDRWEWNRTTDAWTRVD